jgi:cellulase/cellobiase CelA1
LDSVCVGGGTPSDIEAAIILTNDWGTGYCANIEVSNNAGSATTSWTVELDMAGSAIYTSWSGNFYCNVTVGNAPWNGAIGSGQSIASAGFCANRNGGGTASVVSATGTF